MSHIQINDEVNTVISSHISTNFGDVQNSVAVNDEGITHTCVLEPCEMAQSPRRKIGRELIV